MMVTCGLTPRDDGTTEPSATYNPRVPNTRFSKSTTAVRESAPIRAVPSGWKPAAVKWFGLRSAVAMARASRIVRTGGGR